jgi:cytochrome c553
VSQMTTRIAFRPHFAGLAFALAALAPAYAAAQTKAPGDRELGQYLASECAGCHQATGQQTAGVPAIVGWPEDQFVAVMQAYKSKERPNQIMQTIAGRLSAEEIAALAAWYGAQQR